MLTERRPDRGLLGGMMGLPTSDWGSELGEAEFPSKENWQDVGEVHHVFTHFSLTLKVWRAETERRSPATPLKQAVDHLPSVFSKALKLALE